MAFALIWTFCMIMGLILFEGVAEGTFTKQDDAVSSGPRAPSDLPDR